MFEISKPERIKISTPSGKDCVVDPYEVHNELAGIDEVNPGATANDRATRLYLADLLKCSAEELATNQVRDFRELIIATVRGLDEERKKKIAPIACLR